MKRAEYVVCIWRLVLLLEQSILQNLQVRFVYGDLYYSQSNQSYRLGLYMETCTTPRAIYPTEPTGSVCIWRLVLLLEQSILQNLQVRLVDLHYSQSTLSYRTYRLGLYMETCTTLRALYPTEPTSQVGIWRLVLLLEQSILQNLQVRFVYGDLYYSLRNLSYRTYRLGLYMETCTTFRAIYPTEPTGWVCIWRLILLLEQSILQKLGWYMEAFHTHKAIFNTNPYG